ncbi:hypothetical protein XNC3_1100002 [Xenorhabdus nematophila F1]|nr:hypothetical protein XNC3_1100002 [Xenorhabdus nematophila F1]
MILSLKFIFNENIEVFYSTTLFLLLVLHTHIGNDYQIYKIKHLIHPHLYDLFLVTYVHLH